MIEDDTDRHLIERIVWARRRTRAAPAAIGGFVDCPQARGVIYRRVLATGTPCSSAFAIGSKDVFQRISTPCPMRRLEFAMIPLVSSRSTATARQKGDCVTVRLALTDALGSVIYRGMC